MTQADNVLSVLRQRGARGVHTHELRGLFIANPSQRIAELKARGHVISTSARVPLHGRALGVRYTLVVDAERLQNAEAA
jgi:hypothetical protein